MSDTAAIDRIIYERAWKFHRQQPGMEVEDLVQEAYLLIETKVRDSFREDEGASFLTLVYRSVTNLFISLTHYHNRRICETLDNIIEPSVHALVFETDLLSPKAQEAIDMIFNHSEEVYGRRRRSGISPSQKLVREALRNRGWKFQEIDSVFEEIKAFLKCNQ